MIAMFAAVNTVLMSVLFVWHLGAKQKPLLSDIRTYIYVGMILTECLIVYDFLFGFGSVLQQKLVVLVVFNLVSLMFMAVSFDYVRRAAELLDESASLIKLMKVITATGFAAVLAALAYEIVFEISREEPGSLCETLYFTITSAFNLAVNVAYLLQLQPISKLFREIKQRQLQMI